MVCYPGEPVLGEYGIYGLPASSLAPVYILVARRSSGESSPSNDCFGSGEDTEGGVGMMPVSIK